MAFAYDITLFDPLAAFDPQDDYVKQAMDTALSAWSQYLGGLGTLHVQLIIKSLGASGTAGLTTIAQAAPATGIVSGIAPDGHNLMLTSGAYELQRGTHLASYDINVSFNSALLPTVATTQSYDLVTVFEHELMHGLGVAGYRTSAGPVFGAYETKWDSLTVGNGALVFTGAAADYVYGGFVPVTTGLGPGSNYYHVGAFGGPDDPAVLRNDLIYPIAGASRSISALDVAILEDIGVPLSLAGYALIDPNPTTTFAVLSGQGTVSDPLVGGVTQPGEYVTILSDDTVLGSTTASAAGTWSFHASALADGTSQVVASLPGAAGAATTALTLTLDATTPVLAAYQDVLGRVADSGGLAGGRRTLVTGTTAATLRAVLATSVEGSTAIYNLFLAAVGRAVTSAELPAVQRTLAGGASLAGLRSVLASSSEAGNAVRALWQDVTGRAVTASEAPAAASAIANGASIAGLRAILAASAEAGTAVTALFMGAVGRAATATEAAAVPKALAGTASLASLRGVLADSTEGGTAISALFQSALGRAPTGAELPAVRQALAAGATLSSLRGVLATSTEFGTALSAAYQSTLGRAPTLPEAQAAQANIASGSALSSLRATLVGSAEAASTIGAAIQLAAGRPANAVEVAADLSELASGYALASVKGQIGQLAGGLPPGTFGVTQVAITPQTIAGPGPNLVYGLLNNDALIASQPRTVLTNSIGDPGVAHITGFDIRSDILQIQSQQSTGFSRLNISALNSGTTLVGVGNGGFIFLDGVAPTALTPANFRFV